MALTPQEFAIVTTVRDASIALHTKANDIAVLMQRVYDRSDPSDPLNNSITLVNLYADYYQTYNETISGLAALAAPFTTPLPPPA